MKHNVTFIDTRNEVKDTFNFMYEHVRYQQGTFLQEIQVVITGFNGIRFAKVTDPIEKDCMMHQLLWELFYITDHCTSNVTISDSEIIVSWALPLHINIGCFTAKEINEIEDNVKLFLMQIDGIIIEDCSLLMVTDASTDEELAYFRDTVFFQNQVCKMLGLQMSIKVNPHVTR